MWRFEIIENHDGSHELVEMGYSDTTGECTGHTAAKVIGDTSKEVFDVLDMMSVDIRRPDCWGGAWALVCGRRYYIGDLWDIPTAQAIRALGHINRFTGSGEVPCSVLRHSVWLSDIVPDKYAAWALVHDMSELVLGDIPAPVKRALGGVVKALEDDVQRRIAERYNIDYDAVYTHEFSYYDRAISLIEAEYLGILDAPDGRIGYRSFGLPYDPQDVRKHFESYGERFLHEADMLQQWLDRARRLKMPL